MNVVNAAANVVNAAYHARVCVFAAMVVVAVADAVAVVTILLSLLLHLLRRLLLLDVWHWISVVSPSFAVVWVLLLLNSNSNLNSFWKIQVVHEPETLQNGNHFEIVGLMLPYHLIVVPFVLYML